MHGLPNLNNGCCSLEMTDIEWVSLQIIEWVNLQIIEWISLQFIESV